MKVHSSVENEYTRRWGRRIEVPVILPSGWKIKAIVLSSDGFQVPVKISKFQGLHSKSYPMQPETRSLLAFQYVAGKCQYVCLCVHFHLCHSLSVSVPLYRTYSTSWFKVEWMNEISAGVNVCILVSVQRVLPLSSSWKVHPFILQISAGLLASPKFIGICFLFK